MKTIKGCNLDTHYNSIFLGVEMLCIMGQIFFIVALVQLSPFSPHHAPPLHPNPTSHPESYLPLAFLLCPLYMFLDNSSPSFPVPLLSSPPPLWLLSLCYLFQCLWLYFTSLFVLMMRLHLEVRSYGICLYNLFLKIDVQFLQLPPFSHHHFPPPN